MYDLSGHPKIEAHVGTLEEAENVGGLVFNSALEKLKNQLKIVLVALIGLLESLHFFQKCLHIVPGVRTIPELFQIALMFRDSALEKVEKLEKVSLIISDKFKWNILYINKFLTQKGV